MVTITELAEFVSLNFRVSPEIGHDEFVFTIGLENGRRQTVMVSLSDKRSCKVIEVKSRCCVANNAKIVRSALRRNMRTPLGGCVMDTSTEPHTIDCVQRLVVPVKVGPNLREFMNAVSSIATQADAIEKRTGGEDVF